MGTREEGHAGVVVRGYSGKIRPNQIEAGKCKECGEVVHVDAHDAGRIKTTVDRIQYLHLACEALPPSAGKSSNVIPVGGGNGE